MHIHPDNAMIHAEPAATLNKAIDNNAGKTKHDLIPKRIPYHVLRMSAPYVISLKPYHAQKPAMDGRDKPYRLHHQSRNPRVSTFGSRTK